MEEIVVDSRDVTLARKPDTTTCLVTAALREAPYALLQCDSKTLGSNSGADAVSTSGGGVTGERREYGSWNRWGGSDGILKLVCFLERLFSAFPVAEAAVLPLSIHQTTETAVNAS